MRALSSAHVRNFAVLSGAVLIPVMYFAATRSPTEAELENTLVSASSRRFGGRILSLSQANP